MASEHKVKLPEPFDYAYKFSSPFGGDVWRMSSNAWNGNKPSESAALYTSAQMLAMHEQGRLAGLAEQVRVSIPTDTMEQEFQAHYRRGQLAGLGECDELRKALRERSDHWKRSAWALADTSA